MDLGIIAVDQVDAALTLQKAVDFDGGELCLIKDNILITKDTTLADLEAAKADFSGYAEATIATWHDPFRDAAGSVWMRAPSQIFEHNGGGTDNTIYGWYFKNAGATKKVCAGNFATPIVMSPTSDGMTVEPAVKIALS